MASRSAVKTAKFHFAHCVVRATSASISTRFSPSLFECPAYAPWEPSSLVVTTHLVKRRNTNDPPNCQFGSLMERYSHIRMEAKRRAVDTLSGTDFEPGVAQNWAQFFVSDKSEGAESLIKKW